MKNFAHTYFRFNLKSLQQPMLKKIEITFAFGVVIIIIFVKVNCIYVVSKSCLDNVERKDCQNILRFTK